MISGKKVFAVSPALNEENFIGKVVSGCLNQSVDRVVVINDGSTDRTAEVAAKAGATVISRPNGGVGSAIKLGYKYASDNGADIVVVLAGDNQMHTEEIPALIEPIVSGRADFVKGNRFIRHDPLKSGMPFKRYLATKALGLLTGMSLGRMIRDPCCGYVALSRQTIETTDWSRVHDLYAFEISVLANLTLANKRIAEVPVTPRYGNERSKLKVGAFAPAVLITLAKGMTERLGLWKFKKV